MPCGQAERIPRGNAEQVRRGLDRIFPDRVVAAWLNPGREVLRFQGYVKQQVLTGLMVEFHPLRTS